MATQQVPSSITKTITILYLLLSSSVCLAQIVGPDPKNAPVTGAYSLGRRADGILIERGKTGVAAPVKIDPATSQLTPYQTLVNLRATNLSASLAPTVINLVQGLRSGRFDLDSTDTTSPDDGGLTLVTAAGLRYKRFLNGQPITPQMYGATGDGVTDDLAALQAAYTIVSRYGGKLHFPKGRYRITGKLTETGNKSIYLTGDGMDNSVVIQTTNNDILIYNTNSGKLFISDITFSTTTTVSGCALKVINNSTTTANKALTAKSFRVTKESSTVDFGYGIYADNVSDGSVTNCYMDGKGEDASSMIGISINASKSSAVSWEITDTDIYSTGIGLETSSTVAPGVEGIKLLGTDIVGVNTGWKSRSTLYVPPHYSMHGSHINAKKYCVDWENVQGADIKGGLYYIYSSVGNHFRFKGVQFGTVTGVITLVNNNAVVSPFYLDGSGVPTAQLNITGNFFKNDASTKPVFDGIGVILDVFATNNSKRTAGEWASDVLLAKTDNQFSDNIKSGTTLETRPSVAIQSGALDVSNIMSSYVAVSSASGTITNLISKGRGQFITLNFDNAGVRLQHNASCVLVNTTDLVSFAGQSITLYREYPSAWREVSRSGATADPNDLYITGTGSGDGSTTVFYVAHSLGVVPTFWTQQPVSADAKNVARMDATGSSVQIIYTTPPPAGTNNLTWKIYLKK